MKRSPRWVVWLAACVFVLVGIAAVPKQSSATWIHLREIAPLPYIGDPDTPDSPFRFPDTRLRLYVPMFGMGRLNILELSVPAPRLLRARAPQLSKGVSGERGR
jgi:hypothetical protein